MTPGELLWCGCVNTHSNECAARCDVRLEGRRCILARGHGPRTHVFPSGETAARINDAVNHPSHYNSHPSGIECITIAEHHDFCVGNALKYMWRAGLKGDTLEKQIEDLEKARWYITREIDRLRRDI